MQNNLLTLDNIVKQPAAANPNLAIGIFPFVQILISLVLAGLAIHYFHIELDIRLIGIMPVVVIGFAIYAFLPAMWRLPFLFLMNLAAIYHLLGLLDGSVLAGTGLLLFLLANLPVAVKYRIGAVLAAGLLLALFRAGWLPFIENKAVLPILGSMFMFRMIVYLYEMQFEKKPGNWWIKLNYFFLLPNLIFVIFPVVDYSTFSRNYYTRPAFETYRKGILMMANGIFHLLLYRLIYYYLLPAPGDVTDIYSLLQFMVASYTLIVRLAGIFHFSAGLICLFGFNLPPTFDHYFFANSFSDLWRRINIYWRDFVTKIFYYPIYFRLKKYGQTLGLVLSVLLVFFINWFLHGYQWFWIRGSFPLTIQDAAFWGIFGVFVAGNSVLQTKKRSNKPRPGTFSWAYALRNSFNVLGIFTFMTILWSFWTSNAIGDWFDMVAKARTARIADLALIGLGVLALAGIGLGIQYMSFLYTQKKLALVPSVSRNFLVANLGLAGLALFGLPMAYQSIESRFSLDLEPVLYTKLNAFDREQLYKGYYETLLVGNNLSSRIWELEQAKPDDWKNINALGVGKRREDILLKNLLPNQKKKFKGGLFTTNSFGIRDREYSLEKPDNTLRIVILGGSIEMGTGINTDQTFENVLEDELNKNGLISKDTKVEILNFAISGNHLFQNVAMLEWEASKFKPQVVIYPAHPNEEHRLMSSVHRAFQTHRDLTFPFLKELEAEAGLSSVATEAEFFEKVGYRQRETTAYGYNRILEYCRKNQAVPVWIYVPTLDDNEVKSEDVELEALVKKMGFYTLNLKDSFGNLDPESLKIAPWDAHPNAKGHQLLANEMLKQLQQNKELLQVLQDKAKQE
ncbi:MAG: hypothetical protein H6566_13935 [Lewinellaceae bacterium]|nr:hypothetical protein [Lewinellaceae bacterium]